MVVRLTVEGQLPCEWKYQTATGEQVLATHTGTFETPELAFKFAKTLMMDIAIFVPRQIDISVLLRLYQGFRVGAVIRNRENALSMGTKLASVQYKLQVGAKGVSWTRTTETPRPGPEIVRKIQQSIKPGKRRGATGYDDETGEVE